MRPRILVLGNSQAGCVKQAYDKFVDVLKKDADLSFYVIPGGQGPDFAVKEGKLVVQTANLSFPPYASPDEARSLAVSRYDAIIVSALGYCDGGFYYKNEALLMGLVHEFGPKKNDLTDRPISKGCLRAAMRGFFELQTGFVFLRHLRQEFSGLIMVQPNPLLSSIVSLRPEWLLNVLYENPLAANRFIQQLRLETVGDFCQEVGVDLLPIPNTEWTEDCFTPQELIKPNDGFHPTIEYGKLVVEQIAARLRAAELLESII